MSSKDTKRAKNEENDEKSVSSILKNRNKKSPCLKDAKFKKLGSKLNKAEAGRVNTKKTADSEVKSGNSDKKKTPIHLNNVKKEEAGSVNTKKTPTLKISVKKEEAESDNTILIYISDTESEDEVFENGTRRKMYYYERINKKREALRREWESIDAEAFESYMRREKYYNDLYEEKRYTAELDAALREWGLDFKSEPEPEPQVEPISTFEQLVQQLEDFNLDLDLDLDSDSDS